MLKPEYMNIAFYVVGGLAIAGLAGLLVLIRKRRADHLNTDKFLLKWRDMQKLCGDKTTWDQAVIKADKILEEALKKKHMKGKTEGERLTKAQRILTDNESVWFGHKLRTKLENTPGVKLTKRDVKQALLGIRQALKDLGALPHGK